MCTRRTGAGRFTQVEALAEAVLTLVVAYAPDVGLA